MAKIDRVMVGESLVGDGNEVAHIDLHHRTARQCGGNGILQQLDQ